MFSTVEREYNGYVYELFETHDFLWQFFVYCPQTSQVLFTGSGFEYIDYADSRAKFFIDNQNL